MISLETSLALSKGEFSLVFDPDTGTWTDFAFAGTSLLDGHASFSVKIEGWAIRDTRFVGSSRVAGSDVLILEHEVVAEDGRRCRVEEAFEIFQERVERRLTIRCEKDGQSEKLLSATLLAEGLMAGDPEQTVVSMPMTRSLPALPLETLTTRGADFEKDAHGFVFEATGLDLTLASVMLARPEPPLQIAVVPLPNECSVRATLQGHDGRLSVAHEFACESWLKGDTSIEAAKQVFLLSLESWPQSFRAVGDYWSTQQYLPAHDRPAWAREAIILEVDLAFCGGLKNLTGKLDEIQRLGFNTLYLMPWHPGHWNGYGTSRYDEVNPAYGNFADLRALCDAAHRRGLKVLFDLLVNVAGRDSPYPTEHPDWFYRDREGQILQHPTWRSWCFDPAAPGFRKFLTDYAVRCCTEWGADGFRVDAAAYRGGNWNNLPGVQPHQHSHAIFTLLGEIRNAIRAVNPEAICLAECFGPVQVPVSDLVSYQWVAWLDWVNDGLLAGRITGAALSRLLAEHFLSMPRDTWLTGYTHTHDTVAFEKRELDGPAVAALFATLTLVCAGTMVFAGGWEMRARPAENEADDYRALFAAKTALGGVASHELIFHEHADPALLVIDRPSRRGTVRVISNFSADTKLLSDSGSPLYSRLGSSVGEILPFDTIVLTA